ncbi:MAG: ABC transporter substrate-binding protein [candidate division Zixibacteria bacterium]|nr:ABC transporter substrate-binding protein [candidate division Zixibacteria bacterium]
MRSKLGMSIRILSIVILMAAVVSILFSCGKSEPDVIKIGATLPLTGNSALWGQPTKEGIDLAIDIINNNGGINGTKIEVIYEDTQGIPSIGVTAIKKLINIDKVPAIIDNSNSSVTLAMAPIAESNNTIQLVTGASSPDIADAGEYIYRIWNSDALEGSFIAKYTIDSLKAKSAAILFVNNSYGKGLNKVFTNKFQLLGGHITISESFDEGIADFRTSISKVLNTNPEVIYIVAYPNQGAPLIIQLKELGCSIPVVGAVALEDSKFLEQAGQAANGLIYPLPAEIDTSSDLYKDFKEAYMKKYDKQIQFLAAEGYDGAMIIALALEKVDTVSGQEIKRQLEIMTMYRGVSGPIEFDENGEVNKPFGIREIENGQSKWRIQSIR